jgi:moderate conductance mechanosensitive channel
LTTLLAYVLINTVAETSAEAVTEATSWFVDTFNRAIGPAIRIVIIVIVSMVALRILKSAVSRTVQRVLERHDQPSRELKIKADTLSNVIESAGRMVILLIATMMVLSNIGINIAPLLAGAGVVGLAIGFGAQSLIKDFIGGFFILLEDQYSVGDVIRINDSTGLVEQLSLRRTSLRALDGTVIIIPNGEILKVENLTKDWARAVLDIDISYDDDIDYAMSVIEKELEGVENDEIVGDVIIGPPEILGVVALGQYQVTLRAWLKTKPMEQWRVQRELIKRLKQALDRNGVTIPYPHQVTIFRSEDGPRELDPALMQQQPPAAGRPGNRTGETGER